MVFVAPLVAGSVAMPSNAPARLHRMNWLKSVFGARAAKLGPRSCAGRSVPALEAAADDVNDTADHPAVVRTRLTALFCSVRKAEYGQTGRLKAKREELASKERSQGRSVTHLSAVP